MTFAEKLAARRKAAHQSQGPTRATNDPTQGKGQETPTKDAAVNEKAKIGELLNEMEMTFQKLKKAITESEV